MAVFFVLFWLRAKGDEFRPFGVDNNRSREITMSTISTNVSPLLAILFMVALVGGCASGTSSATTSEGEILEFVFPGGEVKSGRVILAPDTQYSRDKTGSTFVLKPVTGPGPIEKSTRQMGAPRLSRCRVLQVDLT